MDRKDEELLKRLLPMFRAEAEDHLKVISAGLLEMEDAIPERLAQIVETIFRESHSLKGAARSVNLTGIVALCQSMENVFSAMKRKEISPSPGMLDLLFRAVDCATRLATGEAPLEASTVGKLVHGLEALMQEPGAPIREVRESPEVRAAAPLEPTPAAAGSVRVSTAKLDALLMQAEEMLTLKLSAAQHAGELRALSSEWARWWKGRRGAADGETKSSQEAASFVESLEFRLSGLAKAADEDQRSLGARVDELLYDMKEALMLPTSSLIDIFPKLARDLSREAGKEVKLTTGGGEIEVDRRVLEEIKDPLIHLVRNGVDHGIERPEERQRKGKPPVGIIGISVSSRDDKLEIAVFDDGAGIDAAKVRAAAERSGSLTPEEAKSVSEQEAFLLIFRSGVTSSPIVTDLSGRGLGLAIVRERVERLGGTVSVESKPDAGTTFRLQLPLTLATFRGILVRAGEQLFILPATSVERVARVEKAAIKTVENREAISLDGRAVSFVRLRDTLGVRTGNGRHEASFEQVALLSSMGKRIAFSVDEILGEQEVLVKNLGAQLSRVRNIAGATILGNGKVVPILNVADLMVTAAKLGPTPAELPAGKPVKRASILVVEDSITARTLLKSILESAGYEVQTAVDGVDGFTALKTRDFDLVVSDVDMPRMNGFALTAKVRADKKLAALPVILVTALDSREDRERGIDVGANAYIVKSSFEQSNLLEVVRRFL